MPFPESLPIRTRGPLDVSLGVPGSKSISNRVLLVSALAEGQSRLRGVLDCDDTRVMARALEALGAGLTVAGDVWTVAGVSGRLRAPKSVVDVGASGTAARFVTALGALVAGGMVVDGTARLRQRPVAALVDALVALGADITVEGKNGCPPVRCRGSSDLGGQVEVDARSSSQFVSALLLIAPYAQRDTVLRLRHGVLASRPYVDVTLSVMRAFGARPAWREDGSLWVEAGATYRGRDCLVEPDASTAAYFFGAAAIAGGRVRVEGLPGDSVQADMGLLGILEQMGCRVHRASSYVEVQGPVAGLNAVDVDMNAMPDAVLALAVVALFAKGTTNIRNVAHLRIKESDRLAALQSELRKLGAQVRTTEDAISITSGELHGAAVDTYDDHRMAMAFALAGLRVPGIVIRDPGCAAKSWPGYFEALARL